MLVYYVYVPDPECSEKKLYTTELDYALEVQKLYFNSRIEIQYVWTSKPPINELWWEVMVVAMGKYDTPIRQWEIEHAEPTDLDKVRKYGPGRQTFYHDIQDTLGYHSIETLYVPGDTLEEACKTALDIANKVWPIDKEEELVEIIDLEVL